ncbi:hypothetical protein GCM10012279_50160 [Micromonospora yangpuensis]|nr:hypothetical protein GCM10012279_50160 [Micromonospora yangpuensis]
MGDRQGRIHVTYVLGRAVPEVPGRSCLTSYGLSVAVRVEIHLMFALGVVAPAAHQTTPQRAAGRHRSNLRVQTATALISSVVIFDVRFPTPRHRDGSDAVPRLAV